MVLEFSDNSWNFQFSRMKTKPVARIRSLPWQWLKLIDLWEIGLFHSFRGFEAFIKVPVIIIIRFGENNVLVPIYVDIYQLGLVVERIAEVSLYLWFYIHKNGKITRTWPILKSNYTSFSSNNFFFRINNKKKLRQGVDNGAPLKFFRKWVE